MCDELYFKDSRYNKLVVALCRLEAHPETGRLDYSEIKETLGVVGDIWPEDIREDAEKCNH